MLTYTQQLHNKALFEQAKAKAAGRQPSKPANTKRPKWAFAVLAYAGGKVEVFDDYTFARKWTAALGGGAVYPRDAVADYTTGSVTLKGGMALHEPEVEDDASLDHDGYYGS